MPELKRNEHACEVTALPVFVVIINLNVPCLERDSKYCFFREEPRKTSCCPDGK